MSILRVIVLGGTVALSTAAICLVSADRLDHAAADPSPAPMIARMIAPEPAVTGTIMQQSQALEPSSAPVLKGFDTERLNALMRGEMPPPPARKR